MRTVKAIHATIRDDIGDLTTRRALPNQELRHLDPFLFLNHHGPQIYPPDNSGLPFGPHPHRGFETVTFILKGDLIHEDTGGHRSLIRAGGVQWMTAGRGLIHSELSSNEFKNQGGDLEILQLWLNLPSKLKMTEPAYTGLQENQLPALSVNDGKVHVKLISGEFAGRTGPIRSLTGVQLMTVRFDATGHIGFMVPPERNVFCYVVSGRLKINGETCDQFHLVEFNSDGREIEIEATEAGLLLFGHGLPYHEPIVSHGPFVMNTKSEILQAIKDFEAGRFG